LALIEHETSLLYEEILGRMDDPRARILLLNVLEETKKHKLVLENLSRIHSQAYPPELVQCDKVMGKAFKESMEFTKSLRDSIHKGISPLDAMKKLVAYEEAIGEEMLTQMHSRVKLIDEKDPVVKMILGYIAADEERHEETLKLVISLLKEKV
jgi:rubrerythrin